MARTAFGSLLLLGACLGLGCPNEDAGPADAAPGGKPKYQRKGEGRPVKPGDVKSAGDADADGGGQGEGEGEGDGAAPVWAWELPTGINTPPEVPADNPMTPQKVELGHKLFMDKRLSADGSRSCYSCHQNHHGNGDGRKTALGAKKVELTRNTPTIWNVGLHKELYWEGRASSLEKQAIGALKGANMGLGDDLEAKAEEIGALDDYKEAFTAVFELGEGDKVTSDHVAKALSAYERTLLCGDTGFDKSELSEEAKRGKALFLGKAACFGCHTGDNLSDGRYHVTGVGVNQKAKEPDVGRFSVSENEAEKFAFKTPTLRNVANTGPYFHDGGVAKLEDAVKIMAGGGKPADGLTLDQMLRDVQLTDDELKDLVAFLESLSCPGSLEEVGDQTADGIAPPKAE